MIDPTTPFEYGRILASLAIAINLKYLDGFQASTILSLITNIPKERTLDDILTATLYASMVTPGMVN